MIFPSTSRDTRGERRMNGSHLGIARSKEHAEPSEVSPRFGAGAAAVDQFLVNYGLFEQPFGVTPDPRFLYLGSKPREALAALEYGTEMGRGFMALIAAPGMGKTSLLFQYLERLRGRARTAYVFQTDCDSRDLLRAFLCDLGIKPAGKDMHELRVALQHVLLEEMQAGRRVILVIDEAQKLSSSALESVRLLSNFETPAAKLIQIVLAGQPELAQRLARPELAQLRQRISFFVTLEPFTREEVHAYIAHRLWVAGYAGPALFTPGAQLLIAERSASIPRNINNICFSAMSLGLALDAKKIDREMIAEVLPDLGFDLAGPPSSAPRPEQPPSRLAASPDLSIPMASAGAPRRWLSRVFALAALLIVLGWLVVGRDRPPKQMQSSPSSRTGIANRLESPNGAGFHAERYSPAATDSLTLQDSTPSTGSHEKEE